MVAGGVKAQRCFTDEMHQQLKKQSPKIAEYEAELKAQLDAQLQFMNLGKLKTTAAEAIHLDTETLYVPVVFHIIHDYDDEYVSDNDIYEALKDINALYNREDPALVNNIVNPYKGNIPGTNIKYASKTNIRFVLPTKDPLGNPTHGITRQHSWLAYQANNQAKLNQWPRENYINIWIVRKFGGSVDANVAAYALQPSGAAQFSWYDGVIGKLQNGNDINLDNTLGHELGHSLSLNHPWNTSQSDPGLSCGDDDVDDTPPTKGHNSCSAADLRDTACAVGYMKTYSGAQAWNLFGLDSNTTHTINYPDTVNTQNMMDYSYCSRMVTYLQGVRMRNTLRTNIAGRDILPSATNLANTGALAPRLDLAPIADFSIDFNAVNLDINNNRNVFFCANNGPTVNFVTFRDRSWNDTITARQWTFSNGALTPTSNAAFVANKFSEPGWVSVTLTATGNNTGSTTITKNNMLYIADPSTINPENYIQDFNQGGDLDKYPIFNYFNNEHKWEVVNNAGVADNTSIRYKNYDKRQYPPLGLDAFTNAPGGDYDDFFTPAFDVSGMGSAGGPVYLNFFSAGAFRTNVPVNMRDTLMISYSTTCGNNWVTLKKLYAADIANNGIVTGEFTPSWGGQWTPQSIELPAAARNAQRIFFRFRYRAGNDDFNLGTGNNFYIDRLHLSKFTASVSNPQFSNNGIALAPNPTSNNAFVIIKNSNNNKSAQIVVTDVTGKLVYNTEAGLNSDVNRIEIPASALSVKGIYLVQVTTGGVKQTEKLVVY